MNKKITVEDIKKSIDALNRSSAIWLYIKDGRLEARTRSSVKKRKNKKEKK